MWCRLCAENPAQNFLPSPGTITAWKMPTGAGIRIDSGVQEGFRVSPYYDPLLAKLITHGADRAQAIARMRQALDACRVDGVRSNLGLHRQIMDNAWVRAGDLTTNFLSQIL